ncbi:MAG: M3 family oligoendopeptidase [Candidatus Omnitrophica bacterium]|nr:M3 family oligoendopeptidase [Candidatus Omnitrophota bacterium]
MDLAQLPAYQQRTFVPEAADLTDVKIVKDLYQKLLDRPIYSSQELQEWLLERSELDAALNQTASILYIHMTCHTDDPQSAGPYTQFIQTVPPAVKPLNDELNRKYLKILKSYPLDASRYQVYNRATATDVDLFIEANVPLQTKVDLLSQEYQTVCGAMTVDFDGKEQTMPQIAKYLLEPARQKREDAWRAMTKRRMADKDRLEHIFDEMFKDRCQIAANARMNNFIEYQFRAYHRFDYTPSDCKKYHETVEKLVVPLYSEILKKRRQEMKLKSLRPWDMAVDPQGRKPLKPFEKVSDLTVKTQKIFNDLDNELGSQFQQMKNLGLLDLESHKGKAPGGYQNTLSEARRPFIFMNAVGVDDDVRTLLHEGGHAFHALACAQDPLLDYRHAPMEFCELASMAMELLGGQYMDEFYTLEDTKRSNREHLESMVHILVWAANIDAFQHWLYEHPNHSPHERRQAWVSFYQQFGGKFLDWQDLKEEQAYLWHRQLHIFEVPLYYIEYGIAQLGALQLWLKAKKDPKKALADYRHSLSLGGSRPLPELYEAAGIKFDFSQELIKPLVDEVYKEWSKLW